MLFFVPEDVLEEVAEFPAPPGLPGAAVGPPGPSGRPGGGGGDGGTHRWSGNSEPQPEPQLADEIALVQAEDSPLRPIMPSGGTSSPPRASLLGLDCDVPSLWLTTRLKRGSASLHRPTIGTGEVGGEGCEAALRPLGLAASSGAPASSGAEAELRQVCPADCLDAQARRLSEVEDGLAAVAATQAVIATKAEQCRLDWAEGLDVQGRRLDKVEERLVELATVTKSEVEAAEAVAQSPKSDAGGAAGLKFCLVMLRLQASAQVSKLEARLEQQSQTIDELCELRHLETKMDRALADVVRRYEKMREVIDKDVFVPLRDFSQQLPTVGRRMDQFALQMQDLMTSRTDQVVHADIEGRIGVALADINKRCDMLQDVVQNEVLVPLPQIRSQWSEVGRRVDKLSELLQDHLLKFTEHEVKVDLVRLGCEDNDRCLKALAGEVERLTHHEGYRTDVPRHTLEKLESPEIREFIDHWGSDCHKLTKNYKPAAA